MKKAFPLFILLLFFSKTQSQTIQGDLLIRIKSTDDLSNITNEYEGNIVYNSVDKKIYKYNSSEWVPIGSLIDDDLDTYINVDNGSDNDLINFTIRDTNFFKMDRSKIEFLNSKGSIFIGEKAGITSSSISEEYNIFIGYESGLNNNDGNRNTGIGCRAISSNTTGSRNTGIGNKVLYLNTTGEQNTSIGDYCLYENTTGSKNVGMGEDALASNRTGSKNTAVGSNALKYLTTGSNNIAIGAEAYVSSVSANNEVRMGNNNINYAAIQVGWSTTSDKKWKKDIKDLVYGMELINQLRSVDYLRKGSKDRGREMGFIAQEVDSILNAIGYDNQGFLTQSKDGFSLRYSDFIALLVKGNQEQDVEINRLKRNNDMLMKNQDAILHKIKNIETKIQ